MQAKNRHCFWFLDTGHWLLAVPGWCFLVVLLIVNREPDTVS